MGLHWGDVAVGAVLLAAGLTALVGGQPYGVWFALLLPGVLLTTMILSFTPLVRMRYRQAEQRRLEAEEFRRAYSAISRSRTCCHRAGRC